MQCGAGGPLTGSTWYRPPLHLFIRCLLFLFLLHVATRGRPCRYTFRISPQGSTDLKPGATRASAHLNAFLCNKIQLVWRNKSWQKRNVKSRVRDAQRKSHGAKGGTTVQRKLNKEQPIILNKRVQYPSNKRKRSCMLRSVLCCSSIFNHASAL